MRRTDPSTLSDEDRAAAIVDGQQALRIALAVGDYPQALTCAECQLQLWEGASREFVEDVIEDLDRAHLAVCGLSDVVAYVAGGLHERAARLQSRADALRGRFGATGVPH